MVRSVVRGKVVPGSETELIKVTVSAAPGTGGRQRQRANNIWNDVPEFLGEIEAFLDEELPENDLTP